MTKTLETDLRITLGLDYEDDSAIFSDMASVVHVIEDTLATGTSSDQADRPWWDKRTLAATSENLDLAGGLTDIHDDSITLAKIRLLLIQNTETDANKDLYVGGAAANAFQSWLDPGSDRVKVPPGGFLLLYSPRDGFAVTAGTGDQLKIDAGANSITYNAILVGTST